MNKFDNLYSKILSEDMTSRTTLYHRSLLKMKVGDKIKPSLSNDGKHWLEEKTVEKLLEEYRKEKYPNKPSRFSCIYSTPIPRSRFTDKGYLYVIKPIGKIHVANSLIIDEIGEKFSRNLREMLSLDSSIEIQKDLKQAAFYFPDYLAESYWSGKLVNRINLESVEILSEGAEVIEVINDERLKVNDIVLVNESSDIKAECRFFTKEDHIYDQKALDILEKCFVNPKIEKEPKYGSCAMTGPLKKGLKLKIVEIVSGMNVGIDNLRTMRREETDSKKYKKLSFNVLDKYLEDNQDKTYSIYRLLINYWNNEKERNFGRIFKKI